MAKAPQKSAGCCSVLFSIGSLAFFLWFMIHTYSPKCTIHSFYLPALDKALNDTTNTTLFLSLRLRNRNWVKGFYYDALNLTFTLPNTTTIIATATVPKFYQGHNKRATKRLSVILGNLTAVTGNGTTVHSNYLRVDLVTAVRYKIQFYKTKRHKFLLGTDVEVNDSGEKVKNKDIRLSAAPRHHPTVAQLGFLLNLLVFISLNIC